MFGVSLSDELDELDRIRKFVLGLRRLVINYKVSTAVISIVALPLLLSTTVSSAQAFNSLNSTHAALTPVEITADGHDIHMSSPGISVADALSEAKVAVGPDDAVVPSANTELIGQPTKITVLRANPVVVTDYSGIVATGFSVHTTGSDIVQDMGVPLHDKDVVDVAPVENFVADRTVGTHVIIDRSKQLNLMLDGQPTTLYTRKATLGQALAEAGIILGPKDQISEPATTPLGQVNSASLNRYIDKTITAQEQIPQSMTTRNDPTLAQGTTKVADPGAPGLKSVTYRIVSLGGNVTAKDKLTETVITQPRSGVILRGTKVKVVLPASGARALGYQMMRARGWGDDQWVCLDNLWSHESGWRVNASNASGAYGIPQAMPGAKMASAGSDWSTNAATQISWGLSYIAGKYGSPCAAWSHWEVARSY